MSRYPCAHRYDACSQLNKEFPSTGTYSERAFKDAYRAPNLTDSTCPHGDQRNLSSKVQNPLEIVLGCPTPCQKSGPELCNDRDDDECDGRIDEGCPGN